MQRLGAFAHTEPPWQAWRDEARLSAEFARGRFFLSQEQTVRVPLDTTPDIVQRRRWHYPRKGLLDEPSRTSSLLRRFRA